MQIFLDRLAEYGISEEALKKSLGVSEEALRKFAAEGQSASGELSGVVTTIADFAPNNIRKPQFAALNALFALTSDEQITAEGAAKLADVDPDKLKRLMSVRQLSDPNGKDNSAYRDIVNNTLTTEEAYRLALALTMVDRELNYKPRREFAPQYRGLF